MKKLVFLFSAVILGLFMAHSVKAIVSVATDFDSVATINSQYEYQIVATPDNGAAVFTLLEAPDGMTLSSTGLLEWVPTSMDQGGLVQFSVIDDDLVPNTKSFYIYVSTAIECTDNIIAYWKLNETSGIYEDFANGHNASTYTSISYDVNGKVDTAQRLIAPNNDTKFLFVDDDVFDFGADSNFAISFWFKNKPHYGSDPEIWFAKDDDGAGDNWWWMGYDQTSHKLAFEYETSVSSLRGIDTNGIEILPSDTSWHHAVVHFHGSTSTHNGLRFSIDGNYGSYYQFGDDDVNFTGSKDLTIGWWEAFATNFYSATVVLDEIVFYDFNLTSQQVTELYNDGVAGKEVCKVGNTAPIIKSTPVTYASESSPYNYTLVYGEIDAGDIITLSDSILPSWLSFDPGSGLLSGTPTNDDTGDTIVSLKVSDGKMNVYQTFDLTVGNVNTPPTITSTAPTSVDEDVEYSYQIVVDDDDIIHGDVITYTAPTKPDWLNINTSTGLLSGTPTNEVLGTNETVDFNVVVHAADASTEYDEQSFTITVTNINDAPVINGQIPANITTDYNTPIEITTSNLDVTDVDNVYPDDFTLTVNEGLNYTLDGNTVTPATNFIGTLSVGVEISDGSATDDYDLTIQVLGPEAVNDARSMDISIYPVPASESVTFEIGSENVSKISILDIQGREVKSVDITNERVIKLDIADLKSNIYLYKIIGQDKCASGILPVSK